MTGPLNSNYRAKASVIQMALIADSERRFNGVGSARVRALIVRFCALGLLDGTP
jgi:hypothetical protein